jgi:signal transduction histidine kinase
MQVHASARQRRVAALPNGWVIRSVFLLLLVAALASAFTPRDIAASIMALSMLVGLSAAGYLFVARSRMQAPRDRRAWTLVGSGLLITATGLLIHLATWVVAGDVPVFGPIDAMFLAGYSIGLAGFALLPHTSGTRLQRIRLGLDGVIGAVAMSALLWALFLNDIATNLRDAPLVERVIGSAYVLLDIVFVVVMMIVLVRRSSYRFDPRLALFALAGVAQTAADIAFLSSGAGLSFSEAHPLYPINILAVTLYFASASIVDRAPSDREYAERSSTPLWAMILPYGTAGVMLTFLLVRVRLDSLAPSDTTLLLATLLVGLLVIGRQSVAIRENRRLVEAQRTDLVSSISHELRTPLTAMVGFLEILDEDAVVSEAERTEITSIVNHQAAYLARIVSDLVMLASGNTDILELRIAATNIDELVWASVNSSSIDPSTVRVDVERGLTGYVDPDRMEQVLVNLLSNAVRYGGDRALALARAQAGDLVLEIHDDGPGVPRKHELTIWERFERGPHRLNAAVPGSGIGLAVTKAIAKAHGGSAGYRPSEHLGGACFWVRLPGRVKGPTRGSKERADLKAVPKSQTA